jgi:Tol biopolymer transport system component
MLEGAFETTAGEATTRSATTQRIWRRAVPFILTAFAGAVVAAIGVGQLMPARGSGAHKVVRFALPLLTDIAPRGAGIGRHVLAISPQGTHFVYWGEETLHLRALDRLEDAVALRGTEGAREPFFSPDGQWIGFYQEGQLKRIPLGGGAGITLGTAQNPWGISWDSDGVIRYGQGSDGIWQVSPTGSAPARLITVGKGELAHGPQLLPDGNWVLFTFRRSSQDSWDQAQIVVQSLASGERIVLIERGRDARYLPTGHLVYGLNGVLLGVPFDVRARRVTGPAVPLVEGVMDADVRTGAMHFAVSNDGTLVYLSGISGRRSTLTWVDRHGRREPLAAGQLAYSSPRVSPDGTRVAVEIAGRDGVDIHIYDLARKVLTPLTSSPSRGRYPLWTPDSQRVVFYSDAGGGGLYSMAADGTGQLQRLTTNPASQTPYSWADGGRTLLFDERSTDQLQKADIYALSMHREATVTPLVRTPVNDVEPAVSPNGRWLAYTSGEGSSSAGFPVPNARGDVYLRPYPQVDRGRWRISVDGGDSPVWSRNGRELFFISRGQAMSVRIETASDFRPGTPTVMFDLPPFYESAARTQRQWDIAPDGERFLIINPGEAATGEHPHSRMVVVLNWAEELKRLVPTK